MQVNKKVIAAISSAVNAYLEEEQAMLAQKKLAQRPPQAYSPWMMAGRAAAMEMRRTWQLRLVR